MTPSSLPARTLALLGTLLLTACATRFEPGTPAYRDWELHRETILALADWQLSGRLNVLQNNQSDTVLINWEQQDPVFNLLLSGSFGLGAVHVHGMPTLVTVEKAGEDAVTLPSLSAVTREYFGYDFPTAQLLYWVRGIPDPGLPASTTLDENQLLSSLSQVDPAGQEWTLGYDNYAGFSHGAAGTVYLPGRIRARRDGLQLTFLVNEWLLPETP